MAFQVLRKNLVDVSFDHLTSVSNCAGKVLLARLAKLCQNGRMSTNLDEELRQALESHRGDWAAIAARSGVSYSWLSKFVNGHIPNPGYETLKKLHAAIDWPELKKRKDAPKPAKVEA